jgi:DNA anti-recombination protein RmuC
VNTDTTDEPNSVSATLEEISSHLQRLHDDSEVVGQRLAEIRQDLDKAVEDWKQAARPRRRG